MLNYDDTLKYIHSLGMFSHPAGLDRIKTVLEKLGNPQDKFKSIHIAGTNGKGSVSVMTATSLSEAGYKTGLFVSPYIVDFRERITINGEYISKNKLCELSQTIKDTNVKLTEFEFITAVGFLYFAQSKCDIAVIETGLGGRLDATNTLKNVNVSVITKIGFDHTAILGDTVEQIAKEKCGIIKSGVTVTSPNQCKKASQVIRESTDNLIIPDLCSLQVIKSDIYGNEFVYKNKTYETSLSGDFQIENAIIAIETLENCKLNICYDEIFKGLKNAFIPARLEVISKTPLVVLDGAHNPDGADVLCRFMESYKGSITAIVGMMRDKNYEGFLKKTIPLCKNVIAIKVDNSRSLGEDELSAVLKKYCNNVYSGGNTQNAVALAKEISNGNPVFVFGSLYLASEIRNSLKNTYK